MGDFIDDYTPPPQGNFIEDYTPPPAPTPSWSQVPIEAAKNLVPSAKEFGKGLYHTVMHPGETVESIGMIGRGALAHLGLADEKYKPYADAVGKMLMDRYGSMDAFKRTLASDPVGVAADLSTVLSGGELAAARLPSVAGKLGMAARAIDPLVGATKVVGLAGKGAGKIAASAVGNLGTFTGAVPLEEAAKAGFAGGKRAEAFREGLRGDNLNEAVKEATRAIDKMKADRSAAYVAKMQQLGSNPAVLGFSDIDQAIIDASKIGAYKGQVTSKSAQKTASAIGDIVNDWKALNPTDFHTAEGLDALKQKIWDEVVSGIPYEDAKARKVGMDIYHSIKGTITKQDPTYANIMGDYQKAQEILNEMRGELSLGNKNPSTTLRKLQSAMRHNVNTNFGRRKELVDTLAAKEPTLTSRLAGHALESWTPVGLGKYLMGPELIAAMSSPVGWKALGLAPLTSPRLMGETAYWGGVGARKAAPVGSILSYRGSPVALPGRLTEHSPLLGVMPAAAEEDKGHRYGGAVGEEDPEDEGKVRYHGGVGGLAIRRGDGGVVPDVDDYEERLQGALPRYKDLLPTLGAMGRYYGRGLGNKVARAMEASEALRQEGDYDPGPVLRASQMGLRGRDSGGRADDEGVMEPEVHSGLGPTEVVDMPRVQSGLGRPYVLGPRSVAPANDPIVAYHGSPYDFDHFDLGKIGTGEGAQAYGHGLYFAENPRVAQSYKDILSTKKADLNRALIIKQSEDQLGSAGKYLPWKILKDMESGKTIDESYWSLMHDPLVRGREDKVQDAVNFIRQNYPDHISTPGRMYEVRLHAPRENFLDWDRKLVENPKSLQQLYNKKVSPGLRTREIGAGLADVIHPEGGSLGVYTSDSLDDVLANPAKYVPSIGRDVYNKFVEYAPITGQHGSVQDFAAAYPWASETLRKAGIPGIRYLDRGSRGSGEGTHNYVVFDPRIIEILRKYNVGGVV